MIILFIGAGSSFSNWLLALSPHQPTKKEGGEKEKGEKRRKRGGREGKGERERERERDS